MFYRYLKNLKNQSQKEIFMLNFIIYIIIIFSENCLKYSEY